MRYVHDTFQPWITEATFELRNLTPGKVGSNSVGLLGNSWLNKHMWISFLENMSETSSVYFLIVLVHNGKKSSNFKHQI